MVFLAFSSLFSFFLQLFKNVKAIISSRVIQKLAADWNCSLVHSCRFMVWSTHRNTHTHTHPFKKTLVVKGSCRDAGVEGEKWRNRLALGFLGKGKSSWNRISMVNTGRPQECESLLGRNLHVITPPTNDPQMASKH